MTVAIRHDDLRRRNRAMVMASVRRQRTPSRTEIAAATGLSHSTISAISADLIDEGILIETKASDPRTIRRGRPQVALGLSPDAASVIALVLSLNALSASLIDYSGEVIAQETRRLPTLTLSRSDLVADMVAMVQRLIAGRPFGVKPAARIALAVQGTTDAAARAMLWSPITPHSGIAFADILEDAFGIPATVENDCNMIAVALRWHKPERYRDDFIAILLSHGIGMGMVLKGELFTGTQSSGGEFGHLVHRPDGALCRCGRRGCVEAYAGNYAIWRKACEQSEDELPVDIKDSDMIALAARARAGGGAEREAFRRAGEALGFGLGSLFALIDPAPVAIVGHGALAFDLVEPALREALARTAGGQHSKAISFDTEPDEMPLIREGCAMRALTFVDQNIFAPGLDQKSAEGSRE
ncbi:ROK family protein [Mesorhizobium sp. NBSH29]|uniref:ROK family protein n=1 Tax=Mesorhizobium sp. NBSH29 TaxID=2654249 RepID=UPI0018969F72|nr:ROK family protein [Mesorhizobium sp. NBSH29]QPC85726.1 ROK family protein [Mesorhizobium sp. NBSH29]